VYSVPDYIYPLWRSFLNSCFSRNGSRVYLSSPQLDVERLQELVEVRVILTYKQLVVNDLILSTIVTSLHFLAGILLPFASGAWSQYFLIT